MNHQHNSAAAFRQRTPGQNLSQFAQAPRFAFGRASQSSRPGQPHSQRLVEALRTRKPDDVEEENDADNDDDEMLEVEHDEALPTIEGADDSRHLTRSPKRRRYSSENVTIEHRAVVTSPAPPVFRQPTTPASHVTAAQFAAVHNVHGSRGDGIQIRRPAFLRASLAPSEQPEPLPEAFSPHRRGEKFVPGGMAATLQQWVIETGQKAAQSRRGQGYLRGEEYVLRCVVASMSGRAPLTILGTLSDGTEVRLLLVVGSNKTKVLVGSDLGVRAPVWDIQLEGRSWTVGVDWKVVS